MLFNDNDKEIFDDYEEFHPSHLPEPGEFLNGCDVLKGDEHVSFHRVTRDVFEERKIYDMTFNYNLARLNLDSRHPDAGYRYAECDNGVLRAEFTPTTEFCPQSRTLAIGSFRAWNGLSDRHRYDRVHVRVNRMHHNSDEINKVMREIEEKYDGKDSTVVDPSVEPTSGTDEHWAKGP
jgi:hypothetical protein